MTSQAVLDAQQNLAAANSAAANAQSTFDSATASLTTATANIESAKNDLLAAQDAKTSFLQNYPNASSISDLPQNIQAAYAQLEAQADAKQTALNAAYSAQTSAQNAVYAAQQNLDSADSNASAARFELSSATAADNDTPQPPQVTPPNSPPVDSQATPPSQPSTPPPTTDPDNNQALSDYSTPDNSTLTSELVSKVQSQGTAGDYLNLSSDVTVTNQNGSIVASQGGSPLGTLGLAPSGLPASAVPATDEDNTLELKCTLSAEPALGSPGDTIVFDVMPTIDESRSVTYRGFTPIQHPGEILKYEGTSARTFGITVKFISRTVAEADANQQKINLLRSWEMPFYGQGTADDPTTAPYLGAPPPILTLTSYGAGMIGPVKCVLENYQWTWPNDVDWIHTSGDVGDVVPFPVIMSVSLTLKETWSPSEFSKFNLMSFRSGDLSAAFGGSPSNASVSSAGTSAAGVNPASVNTSQLNSISPGAGSIVNLGTTSFASSISAANAAATQIQSQGQSALSQASSALGGINMTFS